MIISPQSADNIYLSPHFDDVAFSLAALVLRTGGGTMIDLFSRSAYVHGVSAKSAVSASEIERISALRDAEDADFAKRVGLVRRLLGAEEPSLRGRVPFSKKGLADDVAQIEAPLRKLLITLLSTKSPRNVFCPAGIGGHINHRATRDAVLRWYGDGRPGVQLWFYEDLHYASDREARRKGLAELRKVTGGKRLERHSWRVPAAKLDLINCYSSQHKAPVESLAAYRSAARWPLWPHEAAWRVLA